MFVHSREREWGSIPCIYSTRDYVQLPPVKMKAIYDKIGTVDMCVKVAILKEIYPIDEKHSRSTIV